MTVAYTLQLSQANGTVQNLTVLSVWQQIKNGSYILIAHSQQAQPQAGAPS